MKITKLEYQKKDPNFVNVYVDDKFIAGVAANDIIRLEIYNNKEISSEELNKIISESEFGKLFNFALNFLSYRPRSEWEIRRKLKFKSQNSKLIDDVIEKLKKIDQVNDETFAKWYIDQRRTFRPKGKRAIEMELHRFGVKVKVESDISEIELAKRALTKHHGSDKSPEKLQRFLLSRGFDWQTIEEVVKYQR